jgi:hypothetical protein
MRQGWMAGAALLFVTSAARAQDNDYEWRRGLTPRRSIDLAFAAEEAVPQAAGVSFAPSYRMSPGLSLGVRGMLGWGFATESTGAGCVMSAKPANVGEASAELRGHVLGRRRFDPWIGLDVGLALARIERSELCAPGAGPAAPTVSSTQVGTLLAGSFGFDVWIVRWMSVGLVTRLQQASLPTADPPTAFPIVSFGLALGFHFATDGARAEYAMASSPRF